ncbi:type II toxin-antitoxin system VapC family toxin [Thermococcus sp. AM4]|uniref:type II toxin-antitoxin system VapC family toxin n=1 Tax=Thermococcus sp. (strain AM4) TaxID=246969 RepID=UPI000186FB3D|nr:type II toxin-antitoxin system VapC family toxin [Thermococcus sp. AM4]EEB74895.1 putative PIN domain protein [Thermococcus sp. AM4]
MPLPQEITFDSIALLKMHTANRKRQLEITLAKFTVYVPVLSLYNYLAAKAYLKRNVERELGLLKEIYNVVPLSDEIIVRASKIEGYLLQRGLVVDPEDVLAASTAITTNSLLVTESPERYEHMRQFGLDVMPLEKFLREMERIVERELR